MQQANVLFGSKYCSPALPLSLGAQTQFRGDLYYMTTNRMNVMKVLEDPVKRGACKAQYLCLQPALLSLAAWLPELQYTAGMDVILSPHHQPIE
jgi:hypothetical protein